MADNIVKDKHPLKLDDSLYCRSRGRRMTLNDCLDFFLKYNAFDNVRSRHCTRCTQGRGNRLDFSQS